MKPYSSFISLIIIIIIPFFIIIHSTSAHNLINTTCKTFALNDPNIDYNFCITSLQAAPASRCAALKGLGSISMRLIRDNVTDTRCFIKHLMKDNKWDPYRRQCLRDCFDLFSDAMSTVKQAMRYYNMSKFNDANVQISSIMDSATACEDGFTERKGVVSPLTKRGDDTFRLSAVAISVLGMIQTREG